MLQWRLCMESMFKKTNLKTVLNAKSGAWKIRFEGSWKLYRVGRAARSPLSNADKVPRGGKTCTCLIDNRSIQLIGMFGQDFPDIACMMFWNQYSSC